MQQPTTLHPVLGLILLLLGSSWGWAAEPVTLANVASQGENKSTEPIAAEFSLPKALHFLDSAALDWQKNRDCMTCHTNYAYLMARPTIDSKVSAHGTVRAYAEDLVNTRWKEKGPRWDAEVVTTAAILAINDSLTTGKLHPTTKIALDRTWTLQRADGGFNWLKCDWPPMESDDYYGAALTALGVAIAPDDYAETPAAKAGLEKLRAYLKNTPAPSLHHEAMILWASQKLPGIMTPDQQKACIEKLFAAVHKDGGWGLASLGDWIREDKSPQDKETSDGYGTGFVIYVLRQSGVPAEEARIQKGIAWLKKNQRESGRWFTRSLHKDSKHFISHAGTAYAVMAIASCEPKKVAAAGNGQ